HAFVEVVEDSEYRVRERRVLRVMQQGEAVHDARSGELHEIVLQRVAPGTHRPGRMMQFPAAGASLSDQSPVACSLPEGGAVVGHGGRRTRHFFGGHGFSTGASSAAQQETSTAIS